MITGASAFQNSRRKRARGSSAAAQRGISRAASTTGSSGGGSSASTASSWAPSSLLELELHHARASAAPASTYQSKQLSPAPDSRRSRLASLGHFKCSGLCISYSAIYLGTA